MRASQTNVRGGNDWETRTAGRKRQEVAQLWMTEAPATTWNLRPTPLADRLWALLIYDVEQPLRAVEQTLLDQRMSRLRARNCSEAVAILRDSHPPALVLTDTSLPDGGWADVLEATRACASYTPLIVVSRLLDVRLCLDVIESGAYEFVVPPLASADLAYIVRGALLKNSVVSPGKLQKDVAPSSLRRSAARAGANR
jgi:DNA-binding NtrC family response regulator